ncbi:MAG TPA: hypothetical protein PK731_07800, partial [Verrucomicrobiota bacterium]|nr:hypothetical protein [Verrucomicrobiota bacterium]
MGATRGRENWFTGLAEHGISLSRIGPGFNLLFGGSFYRFAGLLMPSGKKANPKNWPAAHATTNPKKLPLREDLPPASLPQNPR